MSDTQRNRPAGDRAATSEAAKLDSASVAAGSDDALHLDGHPYEARRTTRRRRSATELAELDAAILQVAAVEHPLTVRGLFYRVMSTGAVEKSEKGYDVIQRRVLRLRRDKVLPYSWVVDGSRSITGDYGWSGAVGQYVASLARFYTRSVWADQPRYVQLWTEKDALSAVLESVTRRYDVPYVVARGFSSETLLKDAADVIVTYDRPTTILQLGDYDPSGVAAWEHISEKLAEFTPGADITFERLAVTEEQIDQLGLQTRPTKTSDTRSRGFGARSVEVDAIAPNVLRAMVDEALTARLDLEVLARTRAQESADRSYLRSLAEAGDPVV